MSTAEFAAVAEEVLCPLDGGSMRPWLSVPVDGMRRCQNPFSEVYRCACGYGRIWPSPSPAEVASFYDMEGYYTHAAASSGAFQETSFADRLRMHLAWRLDADRLSLPDWIHQTLGSAQTICDIGCGGARTMRELKAKGYTVTGIEPDPATVARVSSELEVFSGTAENLPDMQGRRFDAALMIQVLEHCIDPIRALRNVRSLIRPGGTFICEVPNNRCLAAALSGSSWFMLDAPRHLHFFTPDALAECIRQAEFKVERTNYAYYCRQFSNRWIASERRIREALELRPVNGAIRAWLLLALTAFSPAQYKYDSVRIVATA